MIRLSSFWLLLQMFALLLTAQAADKPLPENAQRLKLTYEQAVDRRLTPLWAQHDAQVTRALQKYQDAGKLDEVIVLKAMLEREKVDPAKLPPEARQAKTQFEKASASALESLRRTYLADLNKLMAESTRANRLEDALAIRDEMKSVPTTAINAPRSQPPPSPSSSFSVFSKPSPGPGKLALTNTTKAKEGEAVLAAAEARNPEHFQSVRGLELVKFHDFAEEPMKAKSGGPDDVPGEYARKSWVSSGGGMIFWGPYDKLEAGDYFIVYRLRFFDADAAGEVAFLDVAHAGNTKSGLRPKAEDVPPGDWHAIALPLKVSETKDYEFRLWGSGKKMAMDRVYIFKVTAGL